MVEIPRTTLPELLAVFGARRTPSSASRMEREAAAGQSRRRPIPVSYLESDDSQASPASSTSSYQETSQLLQGDDASEDELHSDDTIHAVPRGTTARLQAEDAAANRERAGTRELPARRSKQHPNYARPARSLRANIHSKRAGRRGSKKLLHSDTASRLDTRVPTARAEVRNEIAKYTKPKRDAFLLANQEYFQPLLPDHNYIDKLQRLNALNDEAEPEEIAYVSLAQQPDGVTAVMKPYQLEGLAFLVHMYENGMSSILGDEMGLGKTLQTLSLFQYLSENKPTTGEHRPHLVVCPLSVLSSWMAEAKKWVPGLHAVRFHGPKAERDQFKRDCLERSRRGQSSNSTAQGRIDLVVTTYEAFTAEQAWFKRAFVWRYCVLDEGHKIKNHKADVSKAIQGLSAEYRLLLTGTPLQNNLHEMWALLHWLFPEVFTDDTADGFKKAFDLTQGKVSTSFMDHARRLLEIIMLRRMKTSPEVNLGLPPKEEVLLYVPLSPMQRFWYTRLLTKTDKGTLDDLFRSAGVKEVMSIKKEHKIEQLDVLGQASVTTDVVEQQNTSDAWATSRAIVEETLAAEHVVEKGNSWQKLMNLLMQLRKACIHPYMLPGAAPSDYRLGEHVKTASGKFIILDKLLMELVMRQGKKVIIFSGFTTCLDMCEDLMALRGANSPDAPFRYARLDGGSARAHRNLSIRLFNEQTSDIKVMLVSTRAGGLGINLTAATEVVFLDEDWNPQATLQAEARAHRIGQTKKVTVYKLCSQGTVEEQMMGRIRKKLYLSAKVMESMRNLHSEKARAAGTKRKWAGADTTGDDAPQLDTASLQSLIRRGAQTLARPEIDVTEMLDWDWKTTLEKCKDKPIDAAIKDEGEAINEHEWLNTMERVECAVFDGKKHQKRVEQKAAATTDLNRADRREGKNTTVEIDGFMINKESLQCADWEAVPTFAGKDPRLAEPKKDKKAPINHQDFCQCCWDGGNVLLCTGCPRVYHRECMDKEFQAKARGNSPWFHCPQHQCRDCGAKTADAGGLIYRCRWCEHGFCEDCLDWEKVTLVGDALPEYEMLGFDRNDQAYYIDCPDCIARWSEDVEERKMVEEQKESINREFEAFVFSSSGTTHTTPATISEVSTPLQEAPPRKKIRTQKSVKTPAGKVASIKGSAKTKYRETIDLTSP